MICYIAKQNESKFWITRWDSSNSAQHSAGNSELFPVWRHSFCNVTRSWHLAGNSFIVNCSCDHELANEWVRCSGRNASYITIHYVLALAFPDSKNVSASLLRRAAAFGELRPGGRGQVRTNETSFGLAAENYWRSPRQCCSVLYYKLLASMVCVCYKLARIKEVNRLNLVQNLGLRKLKQETPAPANNLISPKRYRVKNKHRTP